MTPTEIRTALEMLRKFVEYARYELEPGPPVMGTQFPTQVCADKELARIDALLSALPGETVPVKVDVSREWCEQATRDEAATGDPDCTTGRPAGDTGPAPPRDLVEVVREWQQAYADVGVADTDTAVDAQRKLDRCWAAAEAVRAYPLPAPEAPETPR